MYRILCIFFLTINLLYTQNCGAQLFPGEGRKLCYRLIGFAFPAQPGAAKYKIEIAVGTYDTEAEFEKKIRTTITSTKNKVIGEVPFFGSAYTWRAVPVMAGNVKINSPLHHFSTKITPDVDTAYSHLRIIKAAKKYKDAYVFVDNTRVLYDMKGHPVWFLPGTDLKVNQTAYPRDLKITPQGSITFMTGGLPYEISYDGNILWHYRGNTNSQYKETFNHEFTRLHNGHYMGLVSVDIYQPLPGFKDSVAHNASDSNRFYDHTQFCAVTEYDEQCNIVWRWNGYDYVRNSDLFLHKQTDKVIDLNDLHENSFYFDEQHKVGYLSFRNISRIIKIKYPEGNVLNTYGTIYKPGVTKMDNGLFCFQHSCRVNQKGNLYLYDNNTCGTSHVPVIEQLQEPSPGSSELKKIWEYPCTLEARDSAMLGNQIFKQGGDVTELSDQSMFVSMGRPYCKLFIVSQDKKELWSAVPETFDKETGKWTELPELYRSSIIASRKDLEKLIWNSEK